VRIDDSLCEPKRVQCDPVCGMEKSNLWAQNDDPRRYLAVGRATVGAIISCDCGGHITTDPGVM